MSNDNGIPPPGEATLTPEPPDISDPVKYWDSLGRGPFAAIVTGFSLSGGLHLHVFPPLVAPNETFPARDVPQRVSEGQTFCWDW